MKANSLDILIESDSLKSLWDRSKCINSGCGLPIKLQIAFVHSELLPSLLNEMSRTFKTVFLHKPLKKGDPPLNVILL